MAGNIQGLELQKLSRTISEFSRLSNTMADGFTNIYNYMKELRTCWTGKRVNKVINVWNSNCNTINTNVLYFCDEMFTILRDIYDRYFELATSKRAPGFTVHDAQGELLYDSDWDMPEHCPPHSYYKGNKAIAEKVELTDESTIKFIDVHVIHISNEFDRERDLIRKYLHDLRSALENIQVSSDALKQLYENYRGRASSLSFDLEQRCNLISEELNQAVHDVKRTEEMCERDARRANFVPKGETSGSTGENSGSSGENSGSGSHVESSGSQEGTGSGRGSSGGRVSPGRGSGSNSSEGGTGSEHTPGPPIEAQPEPQAPPEQRPPEPAPE